METILNYIAYGWKFFINQLTSIRINDVFDILLVTILFYYVYRFIRDRRASKLAFGVVLLVIIQALATLFNFNTLSFILENIVQIGVIALIIIFQPELRSMLENVGGRSFKGIFNLGDQRLTEEFTVFEDELCHAVGEMSEHKTGALIVIEGMTKLGDVTSTGTIINAQVTSNLIENLFFNKAPLHDGAVIIRDMRVYSAGCVLPIWQKEFADSSLGTRHRAAMGMSEQSDALIIVVSEETGIISTFNRGHIKRNYTPVTLKTELTQFYEDEGLFAKLRKKESDKDKQSKSSKGGHIDE